MKKGKGDSTHLGWRKFARVLLAGVLLCIISITLEVPSLLKSSLVPYTSYTEDVTRASVESIDRSDLKKGNFLKAKNAIIAEEVTHGTDESSHDTTLQGRHVQEAVNNRFDERHSRGVIQRPYEQKLKPRLQRERVISQTEPGNFKSYGRIANKIRESKNQAQDLSDLQELADHAWLLGAKAWRELKNVTAQSNQSLVHHEEVESCPKSISKRKDEMRKEPNVMFLPCGLMLGSSVTVVGQPRAGHLEYNRRMAKLKGSSSNILVSQFVLELLGLRVADSEDPPRILHLNPRLRGDWSGEPVIELNTCYRGQWGSAQRCEGWESPVDEDSVDGLLRCEKWLRNDGHSLEPRTTWWLDRLMGHSDKANADWQYPFVEGQTFVLTIRAGWEGYHISIDGRHISSFPYRTGFVLEEATGLSIKGDISLQSVVATSLPAVHPSFAPEKLLERSDKWKAPPLLEEPIELFIGILSASNHFSERMVARKTWMQSNLITSSLAVARFFVALHENKEVNVQLIQEAAYYRDVVILPFMDRYDLVVLKTLAICEYGVHNLSAKYIMKCDDDTFVRVETVLSEVKATRHERGLYMGNMNLYHKPLRVGKWAVTYQEWPEEDYPPYANGPGYVITSDIANFIVSEHVTHALRLFKMEDVSMGMWVVQFNASHNVHYQHNWKFCQFGCVDDYLTAHYQSPRQMLCMWEKLSQGKVECCNFKRRL